MRPNQWQVFGVGKEFQNHRKQMNTFSFVADFRGLLEVRILQSHDVVGGCLDGGIAA